MPTEVPLPTPKKKPVFLLSGVLPKRFSVGSYASKVALLSKVKWEVKQKK
jgi:hypothetical protein